MEAVNKTLYLFWKTIKACDIGLEEAESMLQAIEEKHGVSVADLKKNYIISEKGEMDREVKLSEEEIRFLKQFKGNKNIKRKDYKKTIGISLATLYKALKTGTMTHGTYERFTEAMEEINKEKERIA